MRFVTVSILDMDFSNIECSMQKLKEAGVTHIHIDVIDSTFAPNISFGPAIINTLLRHDFQFDIHLMIADPSTILRQIDTERLWLVIVHGDIEGVRRVAPKASIGLAVGPGGVLPDDVHGADVVLAMGVQPGRGGQAFSPGCVALIESAKERGLCVGVDGGVNAETVSQVLRADFIVVGSAVTRAESIKEAYRNISSKFL